MHDGSRVHLSMVQMPAVNTPQFDWARNSMPQQAAAGAADLPARGRGRGGRLRRLPCRRREIWVGWPTVKAILANKVAPGLLDGILARSGFSSQQRRRRRGRTPRRTSSTRSPAGKARMAASTSKRATRPSRSGLRRIAGRLPPRPPWARCAWAWRAADASDPARAPTPLSSSPSGHGHRDAWPRYTAPCEFSYRSGSPSRNAAPLFAPRAPGASSCAAVPILSGRLAIRHAGFRQRDGDRLLAATHLAALAARQVAVLELVHHTLDGLALRRGLVSGHVVSPRLDQAALRACWSAIWLFMGRSLLASMTR